MQTKNNVQEKMTILFFNLIMYFIYLSSMAKCFIFKILMNFNSKNFLYLISIIKVKVIYFKISFKI